jgi:UDP-N-acetylmuramate--alanine ligase
VVGPSNTTTKTAPPQPNRDILPSVNQLRVHMIGIGGSGMSGLAALLLRRGAQVSGTDRCASDELARLAERGARIGTRQGPQQVPDPVDLVVASAAVPDDHPELQAARQRNVKIYKYAQMLGELMQHYDGIAISGTHGKSTTTAWLTYVLKRAGLDPNFVIGAAAHQLGGGSGVGDGRHFIAEACEYDRSFLNLHPRRAAILNIEEDHLDYYTDLADIRRAFTDFAHRLPADGLLVINGADSGCAHLADDLPCRVATFAIDAHAAWQAHDLTPADGCYAFHVTRHGKRLGVVRLGLPGKHNVENALAVVALAHDCGVSWESIQAGLADFTGAQRRLELRAVINGIRIVDDYAHHPTEIRATLRAARDRYAPRRLWCVFQPHQHSRTRFLLDDFAQSFAQADRVVVPDIYFVRDTERDRQSVSAADLVAEIKRRGGHATYVPDMNDIPVRLAEQVEPEDVVMTMGAGTIWKIADELVRRLGQRRPT